jgi:hypothetical protein
MERGEVIQQLRQRNESVTASSKLPSHDEVSKTEEYLGKE